MNGRVIGINEAYIPPEVGAVSIGFAIPAATVLDVADQLLKDGVATHPYLGLSLSPITPSVRRSLGVRSDEGALVLALDRDAPVGAAGVRPGDVIVEFAGKPISSVEDLLAALRTTTPGSRQQLAGFENHAGRTVLDDGADPLGRVVYGFGNDGRSGHEGCRVGPAVGTYLHGPLLPRNPWLADWLLAQALAHATGSEPPELEPLPDDLEREAFRVAANRARDRGGRG